MKETASRNMVRSKLKQWWLRWLQFGSRHFELVHSLNRWRVMAQDASFVLALRYWVLSLWPHLFCNSGVFAAELKTWTVYVAYVMSVSINMRGQWIWCITCWRDLWIFLLRIICRTPSMGNMILDALNCPTGSLFPFRISNYKLWQRFAENNFCNFQHTRNNINSS